MPRKVGIAEAAVAGDFGAEPFRKFDDLVGGLQLDFADDESFVGSVELIDFPSMDAVGMMDQVACLIDDCRLRKGEQLAGIFCWNLLLPFEAAQAAVVRGALDGDISGVIAHAHTHGPFGCRAEIALNYVVGLKNVGHEISGHKEFSFNFQRHIRGIIVSSQKNSNIHSRKGNDFYLCV